MHRLAMPCALHAFVIAAVLAGVLPAQTLQHRPPTKPQAPSDSAPVRITEATTSLELPRGTSLQVEIQQQYPMKNGEPIEGALLHPLYAGGKLVIPKGTVLRGKVIALEPDTKTRIYARLRGDFTPFHRPRVQFDEFELPGGAVPIEAEAAADGAPVLQLSAPVAAPKKSLISREVALARTRAHDQVAVFTAPGFKDRALQMVYHQLPYHPERIAAHTAWSFELKAPLDVAGAGIAAIPQTIAALKPGEPETWSVNAVLMSEVTSAQAKPGDPVNAIVVEPVYDKSRQLVVPQGSMLVGKVTTVRAARSLGRNGKLRFTFQQVRFPEGFGKPVEGALGGASTEKTQDLQMDAEGTVTPRNQSSAIAPLMLTVLAGHALDEDGNLTAGTGVASNGFGLVGRVVGIAAGSRSLAAGIGYYAAGLSFYENFLRSGRDVVFPKDTRIEIETTPLRAPVLKPIGQ